MARQLNRLLLVHHFVVMILVGVAVFVNGAKGVPIKPEQVTAMLKLKSEWGPTEVSPSWDPAKDCNAWLNIGCNKQGGIVSIVLSGFPLKSSIPADISRLTDLRQLSLDATGLKGSIPGPALGNLMKKLRLLSLAGNNFTGGISPELGSLPLLETLDLYGNSFVSGGLPAALGNLLQLATLNIYNCRLTGGIPSEFSKLKRLRMLDLSGNRLSGKIPSFLATAALVPNLRILRLQKNAFTGRLPPLTSVGLRELDVSENFLYGSSFVADKSGTYCPATTTKKYKMFKTERNCFTAAPNCPTQSPQRLASTCHILCGTNTASGQCGGHGVCVLSSKLRPVCKCDAGYQQPLGNSRTCVKK